MFTNRLDNSLAISELALNRLFFPVSSFLFRIADGSSFAGISYRLAGL